MLTMRTNALNSPTRPLHTAQFLALLQDPRECSTVELADHFANLHRLIDSLPLTSAAYCFAHNWLTSAQELWEAGDHATARYQVGFVAKKLSALVRRVC
jgi:hypothetical protein